MRGRFAALLGSVAFEVADPVDAAELLELRDLLRAPRVTVAQEVATWSESEEDENDREILYLRQDVAA